MKTDVLYKTLLNALAAVVRRSPRASRLPTPDETGTNRPAESRCRRFWRELIRFLQFGVALSATPGFATPLEVYVFGDSAVDMGNYHALPEFAPGPHAVYYTGPDGFTRLCDGPMWPERLYPGMKVWSDPQRAGNRVNFAYGDAKTDLGCQTFGDALPIGVQSQLQWFAAEVGEGRLRVTPQSYFFVEAGPNDFFEGLDLGTEPATVSQRVAANLADAARRLTQLGGRTIFIHDIPDFGDAPAFYELPGITPEQGAAFRTALNAMAADGRVRLREALSAAQRQLGRDVNVVTLPINALFTAIRANPTAFGFRDVTGKIYDSETDTVLVGNPAERARYLFVDFLHLSAAGQEWESRYYGAVIDAIEGRPQQHVARLADAALGAADRLERAILRQNEPRSDALARNSRWRFFVETHADGSDGDTARAEPAWGADSGGVLAGAQTWLAPEWTAGFALGTEGQRGHTEGRTLKFELGSIGGWVYAARELGGVTLRSVAGVQRLDYRLKRDPRIPTMLARSETEGWLATACLEAERRVHLGRLEGALYGRIEESQFEFDGFTETGAPGLNLRFARTRRDAADVALGFRSGIRPVPIGVVRLEPFFWLEGGYAFGDRFATVEATLVDNTANPTVGRVSVGAPWQVRGGFGAVARIGEHQRLELGVEALHASQGALVNAARISYRYTF